MAKNEKYVGVPLVVYIQGERIVIGEATIKGSEVYARLDESLGDEVMEMLGFGKDTISFGWTLPSSKDPEPPALF